MVKKIDIYKKCWCNSGKSYKNCHMTFDLKVESQAKKLNALVPTRRMIKTEKDIEGIKKAAAINNGLLDMVEERIKEGISTLEIDNWCVEYLKEHHAHSADFNYQGYPKSIFTSISGTL